MKIKSKYLGKEFEVKGQDIGGGTIVITHNAISDIISNECGTLGVDFSYIPVRCDNDNTVFICKITDNTGRHIEDIGEATIKSLDTEIAKKFPATMAANRAFDRAAIKYLGLDGKIYSDNEIKTNFNQNIPDSSVEYAANEKAKKAKLKNNEKPVENPVVQEMPKPEPVSKPTPEPILKKSNFEIEGVQDTAVVEDIIDETFGPFSSFEDLISDDNSKNEENVIINARPEIITEEAEAVETSPESNECNEAKETSGTNVIDFTKVEGYNLKVALGRYKSKDITFEELANTDISSLTWIASAQARFEKDKIQIETARRFLKIIEPEQYEKICG